MHTGGWRTGGLDEQLRELVDRRGKGPGFLKVKHTGNGTGALRSMCTHTRAKLLRPYSSFPIPQLVAAILTSHDSFPRRKGAESHRKQLFSPKRFSYQGGISFPQALARHLLTCHWPELGHMLAFRPVTPRRKGIIMIGLDQLPFISKPSPLSLGQSLPPVSKGGEGNGCWVQSSGVPPSFIHWVEGRWKEEQGQACMAL